MLEPLHLSLEFARAADAGDPFAARVGPQLYLSRSEGGAFESTQLDWSAEFLEMLEGLQRTRVDPKLVQAMGDRLAQLLEPLGWPLLEQRLLRAVKEERTVFLGIRSAAAELYALPWELLTLKGSGQHLGELPNVLIRYHWPDTSTTAPPVDPAPPGGRVLFAWSAAAGQVPFREHATAIREAARGSSAVRFSPQHDIVASASPQAIVEALTTAQRQGNPVSVLHLLCHGTQRDGFYALALNDPQSGDPYPLDPARLRQLLAPFAGMVRTIIICACQGGNTGVMNNHLGSAAQTLHRAGFATVIASRFPFSVAGSVRFANVLYQQLIGEVSSLEDSFRIARYSLLKDITSYDWASVQFYARPEGEHRPLIFRPYRGLLAFQSRHSRFFFGRSTERQQILQALQRLRAEKRPRMLMIAGASGTGKSSVVLAGVVPKLLEEAMEQARPVRLLQLRPGSRPLAVLEEGLTEAGPILLVIDQFEETFTQTPDPAERQAYVQRLWELAKGDRVEILVTIRVDFLGRTGELLLDTQGLRLDQVAFDDAHRVFLPQLSREGLLDAIVGPATQVGLVFDPGLAERMLQEVVGEPGALPLLQYALDEVWLRRKGNRLTQQAYEQIGGVIGALRTRAEQILDGMDDGSRAEIRRLLVRLVALGNDGVLDARQRLWLDDLKPSDAARVAALEAGLSVLVEARLLVQSDEGGRSTVEVAHEALIRRWPRLREWVQEDRDMLAQLRELRGWVEQWRQFKTLLAGEQLSFVHLLRKRYGEELGADELELIRLSDEAEEKRISEELAREHERFMAVQKESRRNRLLFYAAVVGMLVMLLLGANAYLQKRTAESAQMAAEQAQLLANEEKVRALDAKLTAISLKAVQDDPTDAVVLLREVSDWTRQPGWLDAAIRALSQPLSEARLRLVGRVSILQLSDDGKFVLTQTPNGEPLLRSMDGKLEQVLDADGGRLTDADIASDDQTVLAGLADGTVVRWSVPTSAGPELAADLRLKANGAITQVEYLGNNLLATTQDRVYGWDEKGLPIFELPVLNSGVVIAPDGQSWVANKGKELQVFSAKGQPGAVMKMSQPVRNLDVSERGEVAAVGDNGEVKLWQNGSPISWKPSCGLVRVVRFSGHGRHFLALGAEDGRNCVFDLDHLSSPPVQNPAPWLSKRTLSRVTDLRFSPSGERLLSIGTNSAALLWRNDGHVAEPREIGGGYHQVIKARFMEEVRLVSVSIHGTARTWNIAAPVSPTVVGLTHPIHQLLVSPTNAASILAILVDGGLRRYTADPRTKELDSEELIGNGDQLSTGAWSADGQRLALASADGHLWVRQAGEHFGQILSTTQIVGVPTILEWAGEKLFVQREVGSPLWWTPGTEPVPLSDVTETGSFALSAASSVVAQGTANRLRLWYPDGKQVQIQGGVSLLRFSPDGKHLLVTTQEGVAWLLDVSNPVESKQIKLRTTGYPIRTIAWSPDGKMVAVGGDGLTALLFYPVDAADNKLSPRVSLRHQNPVEQVLFLVDGERVRLVTVDSVGTTQFFETTHERPAIVKLAKGGGHVDVLADGSSIGVQKGTTESFYPVDPAKIYEILWRISEFCLTVPDRRGLLDETETVAKARMDMCLQQVQCTNAVRGPGAVVATEESHKRWLACMVEKTCGAKGSTQESDESQPLICRQNRGP